MLFSWIDNLGGELEAYCSVMSAFDFRVAIDWKLALLLKLLYIAKASLVEINI